MASRRNRVGDEPEKEGLKPKTKGIKSDNIWTARYPRATASQLRGSQLQPVLKETLLFKHRSCPTSPRWTLSFCRTNPTRIPRRSVMGCPYLHLSQMTHLETSLTLTTDFIAIAVGLDSRGLGSDLMISAAILAPVQLRKLTSQLCTCASQSRMGSIYNREERLGHGTDGNFGCGHVQDSTMGYDVTSSIC